MSKQSQRTHVEQHREIKESRSSRLLNVALCLIGDRDIMSSQFGELERNFVSSRKRTSKSSISSHRSVRQTRCTDRLCKYKIAFQRQFVSVYAILSLAKTFSGFGC